MAVKYDAVVIGAGTGGLSAALALASAGKRRCLSSNTISPAVVLRASFAVDSSSTRPCTNIAALAAKATGDFPAKL